MGEKNNATDHKREGGKKQYRRNGDGRGKEFMHDYHKMAIGGIKERCVCVNLDRPIKDVCR